MQPMDVRRKSSDHRHRAVKSVAVLPPKVSLVPSPLPGYDRLFAQRLADQMEPMLHRLMRRWERTTSRYWRRTKHVAGRLAGHVETRVAGMRRRLWMRWAMWTVRLGWMWTARRRKARKHRGRGSHTTVPPLPGARPHVRRRRGAVDRSPLRSVAERHGANHERRSAIHPRGHLGAWPDRAPGSAAAGAQAHRKIA
jgi:hypothetical protein